MERYLAVTVSYSIYPVPSLADIPSSRTLCMQHGSAHDWSSLSSFAPVRFVHCQAGLRSSGLISPVRPAGRYSLATPINFQQFGPSASRGVSEGDYTRTPPVWCSELIVLFGDCFFDRYQLVQCARYSRPSYRASDSSLLSLVVAQVREYARTGRANNHRSYGSKWSEL